MAEIEFENLEELQEEAMAVAGQDAVDGTPETQESLEVQESLDKKEPVSNQEKLMRSLVSDDDEAEELSLDGIRQILDAAPRWFLSQWKMMLLCLVGVFLYITNGYQAQMEMMKETELEAELKDWRYRSITRVSELTQICRQSQLEQKLREQGDTSLVSSKMAPFIIKVKE
ncbi:MAG: hypothetical protein K6G92_02755 [Bacteroidaceae bacterium]|nr:hypothetical protein [Bacteroidaceae bacterium]